ncbi:MAG: hypothetical protein ACI4WS_09945 [Oscillospiraceae bacterium]
MDDHTNSRKHGKPRPSLVKNDSLFSPVTDPQGMYTGVPKELYEDPVQDADDL